MEGPFYHVNEFSLDRTEEGFPIIRISMITYLVVSGSSEHWSFEHSWSEKWTAPGSKKEGVHKMHSCDGGPLPPSVYLGRHWCHSHDTMNQAFPLCFCMLQVIKNWVVGRPGNEAKKPPHVDTNWPPVLWRKVCFVLNFVHNDPLPIASSCAPNCVGFIYVLFPVTFFLRNWSTTHQTNAVHCRVSEIASASLL